MLQMQLAWFILTGSVRNWTRSLCSKRDVPPGTASEAGPASTESPATSEPTGPANLGDPGVPEESNSTASVPQFEQDPTTSTGGLSETPTSPAVSRPSEQLMSAQATAVQDEEEEEVESNPHIAVLNALSLLVEQANAAVTASPPGAAKPTVVVRRTLTRSPVSGSYNTCSPDASVPELV